MVSNKEINEMLEKKRKIRQRKSESSQKTEDQSDFTVKNRGYLVCDECKGYYELQEGESPEDFESCECGGKLRFTEDFDEEEKEKSK